MALWETCRLRLRDADDHGGCSAVYEHIYNSGSVSLQKKSVDGEGSAAPLRWTSKYLNFPVRAIVCTWDAEGYRDVRISRVLCYAMLRIASSHLRMIWSAALTAVHSIF